jgi:hypothetical protein
VENVALQTKQSQSRSRPKVQTATTRLHVIVEKDVSQLEIPMNDLVLVQVLAPEQDLVHEVSRLWLRDGLPPPVQLHEGPAPAQLQDHVDKVVVLKVGEELDNVRVRKGLVQRDLLRHLLALVLLHQERLGHDLARHDLARRDVTQFIALCEAALNRQNTELKSNYNYNYKRELTFPRNFPLSYFLFGLPRSTISSGISTSGALTAVAEDITIDLDLIPFEVKTMTAAREGNYQKCLGARNFRFKPKFFLLLPQPNFLTATGGLT